jgi:membrane protein DedA with SNARE-associated domain
MTSYFSALVDFVHAHSQYTHIAIFLLALSEAIPVVGTVVPGSTLIIGISALATSANANPWLLLIAATAGAIIGDGLSFWLGQRYHREILNSWPLNKYPQFIARSERLVTQYGAASVFLARFAAVVRAFVPLVAGILRMSPLQFYAANILSALAWAPAHVFPGGAPIDHPKRRAAHNSRIRWVDCCDLYYLCHALVLQGQVILHDDRVCCVHSSGRLERFGFECGVSNRSWQPALIQTNNIRSRTFIFILIRRIR